MDGDHLFRQCRTIRANEAIPNGLTVAELTHISFTLADPMSIQFWINQRSFFRWTPTP